MILRIVFTKLRSIMLFLFFCSIFFQCTSEEQAQHAPRHPHALILKSHIPAYFEGKLVNFTDSLKIYYWSGLVIYELSVNDKGLQTGPVTFDAEDISARYPVIHEYFVHRKDSSHGYWFYSLQDNKRRRSSVDSFLQMHAFKGVGIYRNLYENISLQTIKKPGYEKVEQIVPLTKKDDTYADTVYLYFQNKNDFEPNDYSLSVELDSLSGARMVKSRFIYKPQIINKDLPVMPAKEIWFEIKTVPISSDTALHSFFEKARKQLID